MVVLLQHIVDETFNTCASLHIHSDHDQLNSKSNVRFDWC